MENKDIYSKLAKVQSELKSPKDKDNSFGKYKYRSLEDILENAKPLLKENGLILILDDEIVEICGRFYVKARATVIDENGFEINAVAYARESESKSGMDAAQITGSCSSYARKYAVSGLFCVDNNKDIDSDEYAQETQEKAKKTATKKKVEPAPDSVSNAILNESETAQDVPTICNDCGEPIKRTDKYTVEQIVQSTIKTFGVPCCMSCGSLRLKRIKAEKANEGG